METLSWWARNIRAQFLAGWFSFRSPWGKRHFFSLFWRSFVLYAFLVLDLFTFIAFAFLLAVQKVETLIPHPRVIMLAIAVISGLSGIQSMFDLSNFVREKRRLKEYIHAFNPLHLFISVPFRWARNFLYPHPRP